MTLIEKIEQAATTSYGKGTAVSIDPAGIDAQVMEKAKGWVVRIWSAKGYVVRCSGKPKQKHIALRVILGRLQAASFLRLDASDMGLSDG